jgi:hypothetical protein
MGAQIGRLPDAIRVMPGLVPGIHVVNGRDDFRTTTCLSAPAGVLFWIRIARPGVDGRNKSGHDGTLSFSRPILASLSLSWRECAGAGVID